MKNKIDYRIVIDSHLNLSPDLTAIALPYLKDILNGRLTFRYFDSNLCPIYEDKTLCSLLKDGVIDDCKKCDVVNPKYHAYTFLKSKNGRKFLRIERGISSINNIIIHRCLSLKKETVIEDRRVFPKLQNNQLFEVKTNILKKDHRFKVQSYCAKLLADKKEGILSLPPRQGKTVVALLLSYLLKTRTCILVHMTDLAKQFYETFIEFTNIKDIEDVMKTKIIDINNSDSLPPIGIFTYQQFLSDSKGKNRLNKVKKHYGLLIVDEAHRVSADKYSKVVSRFYSKVRIGLSATPGKEFTIKRKGFYILGNPINNIKIKESKSYYVINHIDFNEPDPDKYAFGRRFWQTYWSKIANSSIIREEILKKLEIDLRQNRKVLIPLKFVKHVETLTNCIKEHFPDKRITLYHGKLPKNESSVRRKKIVKGEFDCVIATKGKVSLGFNAPLFDTIYVIYPVFDEDNFYQEFSRVRTPHPNKKNPVLIRIFTYNGTISQKFKGKIKKIMNKYEIEEINDKKEKYYSTF